MSRAAATSRPIAVSSDGTRVIFGTQESLLPADVDTATDIYESGPLGTKLRSPSPNAAAAAKPAIYGAVSTDASRVLFFTIEQLTAGDTDAAVKAGRDASRKLDKAASKGVIHKNQAANRKSAIAKTTASL